MIMSNNVAKNRRAVRSGYVKLTKSGEIDMRCQAARDGMVTKNSIIDQRRMDVEPYHSKKDAAVTEHHEPNVFDVIGQQLATAFDSDLVGGYASR